MLLACVACESDSRRILENHDLDVLVHTFLDKFVKDSVKSFRNAQNSVFPLCPRHSHSSLACSLLPVRRAGLAPPSSKQTCFPTTRSGARRGIRYRAVYA